MHEEIIEQLKQIIASELDVNVKAADIQAEASLFEGGIGLDSIMIVEFIALIEKRFAFQFADSELNLEPFRSLQTLAQFIAAKSQGRNVVGQTPGCGCAQGCCAKGEGTL